ncbi:MAG: cell division protein FtsZ [Bacteroidales bacterium]
MLNIKKKQDIKEEMPEIIPSNWDIKKSIIKVIGVGGGGSNAVTQMYHKSIKDVEFMISNTDAQALSKSDVPEKLQLGEVLTGGRGAGCNPLVGKESAQESEEIIKNHLGDGIEMAFITAGMGGGTGTGAAPIIARIAKEMGMLTIAVVTQPFKDEGYDALKRAYDGIMEIAKYVDSLLIVDNQKVYSIYPELTILEAFPKVDEVLFTAVKGVAEIITGSGYINVDFADLKTTMKNSGMAIMGVGEAKGENRAIEVVQKAFTSPLLEQDDIRSAKNVLVNISTSSKNGLKAKELEALMKEIKNFTGITKQFKRGIAIDDTLTEDSIRLVVVATGYKMNLVPPLDLEPDDTEDDIIVDTSETSDEDAGRIILNPVDQNMDTTINTSERMDIKSIPIYTQDISIIDMENQTALERKRKIQKEKKNGKI